MTNPQSSSVVLRRRLLLLGTLLGGVFAIIYASTWQAPRRPAAQSAEDEAPPESDDLLMLAKGQLAAGQFAEAMDTANRAIGANPKNIPALLISAEAATRLGHMDQAVAIYLRVPEDHPQEYLTARVSAAEVERVAGSIDAAIDLYRQVLQRDPEQPLAVDRLAGLLSMTGQSTAAEPLLLQLVQQGTCRVEQLQWLADPERPLVVLEYLAESLKRRPDQSAPHLGIARTWQSRGDLDQAMSHLMLARKNSPEVNAEIEATYGQVLLDQNRDAEWHLWLSGLTEPVKSHPKIWLQQGIMAERLGQKAAACRCDLEAIAAAPHLREAVYRAGRLLVELGENSQAAPLLERNALLGEAASMAGGINADAPSGEACRRMAETLDTLRRDPEALVWAAYSVRATPANRSWFDQLESRINARQPPTGDTAQDHWLAASTPLRAKFPLPEFQTAAVASPTSGSSTGESLISFVDEAQAAGIDFQYEESPDPTTEGRRMFELTGGGVAVLDYDQDSWPDLYLTQGAKMVQGQPTGSFLDQIYRNRGGQSFSNVTAGTRIVETGYSQGATAGDFNNDGFPDIYVANFGPNRLFENLGDGTFLEVELPRDSQWTTSCAIADLNRDAIPDLFDVNYVQGKDTWDKTCTTPGGARICTPFAFEAAPDRLCLGNGDGTFRDVSSAAEIAPPCGKGLGLLIAPLDETPGVDLFVANDTVANSLFINESAPGQPPHYRDTATLAGLAFGDDGKPQASMGVASGDFDGNGLLDLHVTNFANESNALYMCSSPGAFEELSRASGIRTPSLPMLGFGTQAIDADRDGDLDLVVTNGDIDDFTHEGRAFRMRPQVYRNEGGKLAEVISDVKEDYFSRDSFHRGRGLARLDWNQDGRDDFVVSHLDEPVSLVTNHTPGTGRTITVRLIGRSSSRDAIGSVVTLSCRVSSVPPKTAYLTAGDGYQAKNEAVVRFSVPSDWSGGTLHVRWPQGGESAHPIDDSMAMQYCIETDSDLGLSVNRSGGRGQCCEHDSKPSPFASKASDASVSCKNARFCPGRDPRQ